MNETIALAQRSIREAIRTPEALFPAFFIPMFFFVVNIGQAARIFPSDDTPFLAGQSYGAFQLPSAMLLAASFGAAAMYLVEDIEGGYFDKLRATPISRMSLLSGRLVSEFLKAVVLVAVMMVLALIFGIRIESGAAGLVVLILLVALWAAVFNGFIQLIAVATRSAAATQSGSMIFFPLLFLTPNFVPRSLLTRPMEVAATWNPVTYIMEAARSLILGGFDWSAIGKGFAVVAAAGALMLALSVRAINRYD